MAATQTFVLTVAPAASAASGVTTSVVPMIEQWRAVMFDRLLILITLAGIAFLIYHVSKVVVKDLGANENQTETDIEVRKVRFAAVTMTGILVLLVFTSLLYYLDEGKDGTGKEIFKNTLTALTPIVGVIVGYLFSKK